MGAMITVDPNTFRNPVQVEIRYSGPSGYGDNFDKVTDEIHNRVRGNSVKYGASKNFQLVFFDYPLKGYEESFEIFINGQSFHRGVPGLDSPEMDAILEKIYQEGIGETAPPDALICKAKPPKGLKNTPERRPPRGDAEGGQGMEDRISALEQRLSQTEDERASRLQKDRLSVAEEKNRLMEQRIAQLESMLQEQSKRRSVGQYNFDSESKSKSNPGIDMKISEKSTTEKPVFTIKKSEDVEVVPEIQEDKVEEKVEPKVVEKSEPEPVIEEKPEPVITEKKVERENIKQRLQEQLDLEAELEAQLADIEGLDDVDDNMSTISAFDTENMSAYAESDFDDISSTTSHQ